MKPNKVFAASKRARGKERYPLGRPRFTPWAMEGKVAPATRSELIAALLASVRDLVEVMR
jgi:hypothetical protein